MSKRPMNPLIELAFASLEKTDSGFAIDAIGIGALQKALHALIGKPNFEETIFDLWALAKYFEDGFSSPAAAADVRKVVFSLKEPLAKLVGPRRQGQPAQLSKAVADLLGLPRSSLPPKSSQQSPGTKWWQVKAS